MSYSNPFIDVAFGDSPFEELLHSLTVGSTLSAAAFLAALEEESEDTIREAFEHLEDLNVTLDISDLPKATATGELGVRLHREAQLVKQGALLSKLEETDPLRLYLEELARIPACGDMTLLAQELEEKNRREADASGIANSILNLSLGRILELAESYTGWGVLLLDLIQEGSMGLWTRLNCYDGGDFGAFRDSVIRRAMVQAIVLQARSNGVGQKMRQAMEDYRSVDEKLLGDLGRNPTLEEIAQELHMSVEETAVVAGTLESARNLSRTVPRQEPGESNPEEEQAVEDTAYFQTRQRIQELLSGLEEQDAKLLSLRFGLEGGLPLSPEETGRRLGLTPEEVVAREAAALSKLRG